MKPVFADTVYYIALTNPRRVPLLACPAVPVVDKMSD